jgi:hypothetical protein
LFIAADGAILLFYGICGALRDPEPLRDWRKQGLDPEGWDKRVPSIHFAQRISLFPVCGLYAARTGEFTQGRMPSCESTMRML